MFAGYGPCRKGTAAAFLSALATGCAIGTAFVRPPEDFVKLGETTRAQIVERFGKPDDEDSKRRNGHHFKVISYTFSSNAEAPKVPNTLCVRTIEFTLADDIVVGEGFVSSCAFDHTDFDEHKRGWIFKGETTCEDVIALFGRPAQRAIYPIATEKANLLIAYRFMYVKRPLLALNIYHKALGFECDADGVVRDTAYAESGEP